MRSYARAASSSSSKATQEYILVVVIELNLPPLVGAVPAHSPVLGDARALLPMPRHLARSSAAAVTAAAAAAAATADLVLPARLRLVPSRLTLTRRLPRCSGAS